MLLDVGLIGALVTAERALHSQCGACRYLDDSVVTQKGRVAAEIQSADELVLSELIFNSNLKVP